MEAARPISKGPPRPTPPALGRAGAASKPLSTSGKRTVSTSSGVQAGKRFTRGNLGRTRRDQTSSSSPIASGPTLQESLRGLSPTKQREELLRHGFGETGGWWANEFVDLFDSVTPALEFFHRRREGVPFDLEDVFIAASVIPGAGKVLGKVGRKAARFLPDESPSIPLGLPAPKTVRSARRKSYVGVASHVGNLPRIKKGDFWLRGAEANAGKIPLQIAEKLAGRQFKNWAQFRRAFWKEVAMDPILAMQFGQADRIRMKYGGAPRVQEAQRLGKLKSFEIDHVEPLNFNGNVYDMNNLHVTTPLFHRKGKVWTK